MAPGGRRISAGMQSHAYCVQRSMNALKYLHERQPASHICVLRRPGGYGGAAAPDPIPNSAVKRSSANGTLS